MITPLEYHRETKHGLRGYARSPGQMEWETQPDPFRRFEGAEQIDLPFMEGDPELSADRLFSGSDTPVPVTIENIAGMLELSLGLSCWKEVPGARWALRMNPSSGNLHPTESYLVLPEMEGHPAAVYHYAPLTHSLERRFSLSQFRAGTGFFLGLTAIFWRESWKYGERAFRYCNHDAGHAAAAVCFAAKLCGWNARICETGDDQIKTLLGLEDTDWYEEESEHPDMLLWIGAGDPVVHPEQQLFEIAKSGVPIGKPNRLSPKHRIWDRITDVAEATPRTGRLTPPLWAKSPPTLSKHPRTGADIIRQRRSAVSMEMSRSRLTEQQFRQVLTTLLPRAGMAPFDLTLGAPRIHPVFFIHNVEGFEPGLYLQLRNFQHRQQLADALNADFQWKEVDETLGLYLLQRGMFRNEAAQLSCGQAICGNGALAVAMLGRFADEIGEDPGRYRELFWEAGMLGQVLYLQAEMSGQRGTGIGCYFDDPVHQLLGITDESYQSIYHFTLGSPVDDERISSLEPYFHLPELRTVQK